MPLGLCWVTSAARQVTSSFFAMSPGSLAPFINGTYSISLGPQSPSRDDPVGSRGVGLDHLIQSVFSAADEVDHGSVALRCLSYRQADARSSASDDYGEVRDIEQHGRLQVLVASLT